MIPKLIHTDNLTPANLIKRLKAPMGHFWKQIRKVMIALGGLGAAIAGANFLNAPIPPHLLTIAGYMIAIGAVGTFFAQLTQKEPTDVVTQKPPPNG